MKKKVVVLGATGSIGKNAALELAALSDRFEVVGLAARNNIDELVRQAEIFRPRQVLTTDTARLDELSRKLPAGVQALAGESALISSGWDFSSSSNSRRSRSYSKSSILGSSRT